MTKYEAASNEKMLLHKRITILENENKELKEAFDKRGKKLRECQECLKMLSDAAKGSSITNWPQQKFALEFLNK